MITTLGGIGLFLLGMMLLTDGVKALAGGALRDVLTRFVRGPVTAMLSGTALTAILQSSSATMLTTIGFVSAGLITFPQAIGVIFGANLGTTSTGWIVSLLGFKLSMGAIALPLVFVGALMRLLMRGRTASVGMALAGFGLLFFGIGLMQEGMGGLSDRIDLAALPGDGFFGALVLVGIGIFMTVAMQSSSAAMAVTLAALHTGGIDITQGAALVIGQNIGTTVTAALAAIGATNAAKRTAVAHILFNVMTGIIAFALLPAFAWIIDLVERHRAHDAGVATLAAFHTSFNMIGVAIFLPVTARFARLVESIVPERGSGGGFARHLDPSVADLGPVGLEVARRTLTDVLAVFVTRTITVCRGDTPTRPQTEQFDQARAALPIATAFVARVGVETARDSDIQGQIELVHAIDHLEQLGELIDRLDDRTAFVIRPEAARVREATEAILREVVAGLADGGWTGRTETIAESAAAVAELRRTTRSELLVQTARGGISADVSGEVIDVVRLLDAVGYRTSRALIYLSKTIATDPLTGVDQGAAGIH